MRIFLIRHTESIGNKQQVYAGMTDYELTENGLNQMKNVVAQFSKIIDRTSSYHLYSSPLSRCTLLSDEIEAIIEKSKMIDNRLRETNFGLFEGKSYVELVNEFPEIIDAWNEDLIHYQIPNGESLFQCSERVNEFCNEIILKNEDSIIVSHGGIIKLLLLSILGLDLDHFWKVYTGNGCIIEIEYNNGFGFLRNIIQLN
ncbi:histidine phosphatase family protein [Gottfriedia luciferensis]|uniref:histidine phosphatase family protein n=1 Tax=Gottfriedia luciferensis TaxID=178774 RepID=UPI000B445335|nr:histidine phosphatase family protein [Gottfriedia luciferensis]